MLCCMGILGICWDWGALIGVTFGVPGADGAWAEGVDAGD